MDQQKINKYFQEQKSPELTKMQIRIKQIRQKAFDAWKKELKEFKNTIKQICRNSRYKMYFTNYNERYRDRHYTQMNNTTIELLNILIKKNTNIEIIKNKANNYFYNYNFYNIINWSQLSSHKGITFHIVKTFPHFNWDYRELSSNENITMEIVKNNPQIPWSFEKLSGNSSITLNDIINNPKYPWKWYIIITNPNITPKIIENNPDYSWNYSNISLNKNITMEFIEKHPEYNWDYHDLSKNENLTFDFISKLILQNINNANTKKYKNVFCYNSLINENKYTLQKNIFIADYYYKYHLAPLLIQNTWKNARISPYTELGIRKINRDYDETYGEL